MGHRQEGELRVTTPRVLFPATSRAVPPLARGLSEPGVKVSTRGSGGARLPERHLLLEVAGPDLLGCVSVVDVVSGCHEGVVSAAAPCVRLV